MSLSKRSLCLLLALTPEVGGRTLTRVLARIEILGISPDEFLDLSSETYTEEFKLKPKSIEWLKSPREELVGGLLETERRLAGQGVRLVNALEGNYPTLLDEFDPASPGVLFAYGNLALLKKPTFSVLASRKASQDALKKIEKITEESILQGKVLVGGVDRVEYQRAAVVPLRWGSPRILGLDRGLYETFGKDLKTEPFAAARLWRHEYDPKTDLALTPFRPDAHCTGVNNQVRDRLVAGLSQELFFAHLNPTGNIEKLLLRALAVGRKVYVSDSILDYKRYVKLGATPF